MSVTPSAVKRALRGLRRLGLVDDTRTGRASVFSINWEAVQKLSAMGHCAPSDSAMCSIRWGTVPHQIAQCAPSQTENSERNSCDEVELRGKEGEATVTSTVTSTTTSTWAAVEHLFKEAGVTLFEDLAREAQQLELSPAECVEIVETFAANRERFDSPGAIAFRVRRGEWPADGVTEARVIREAETKRAAEQQAARDEHRRRIAEQEQGRLELAALERAYGDELDSLDDDERLRFARSVLRDQFAFDMWRRNPSDSYVRHELLAAIHGNRVGVER